MSAICVDKSVIFHVLLHSIFLHTFVYSVFISLAYTGLYLKCKGKRIIKMRIYSCKRWLNLNSLKIAVNRDTLHTDGADCD